MSDRPHWESEGHDWPNRAASRFVETARIRWHVQVMGSGPVMLLIHGTGAATHSWRDLAPVLAEHFTIVMPDLPGHGFTTGRPAGGLSMPAMARALGELLQTLDLHPAIIVGHSAGAAIALRMVLDGIAAPRAVVGLGAALLPFPGLASRLFPTLARLLFVNPFAPLIFSRIARTPGEVGRFLPRSTGSRIDALGIDLYGRLFATPAQCSGAITMMADWDLEGLRRDLPRIRVPMLLVHGAGDTAVAASNAHEAARMIDGARVVELPGLGHLAHEEQPHDVAAIIADFARDREIIGKDEPCPRNITA
ncbi:alpha/beta fold hydrolase [Sphingomonas sp. AR_OL41]|uniref:alpha/beta fold hydrolase BchO n=1 Tax=Sphingomonas sp. AR_OL41 TaxID=3042729 RepID=UPI00248106E6|nr:alpha/beta fold hydrolase BchO [Sphingomonas sp. AR_OL41]MDH7976108.1 alpha/beta fold hydrolase [Sphingomonas sp. AR_OL41]